MRKLFFTGIGVLEIVIALAIVLIGMKLPSRQEVSANFDRVEKVTEGSETQVRLMKVQVADLRKQDFAKQADQLRIHTRTAAATAGRQSVNFDTVVAIAGSLSEVSKGLTAWANTVDAERMRKVSTGLGETANYLETGVADPSEKSAAELEIALGTLEKDSIRLATLLRQSPPDLKAAKSIHDGLASFDTGLEKLGVLVKPDKITAMKEGLAGLETSLSSTADQIDKVSAITYPVVTFVGLKPNVEMKPFWPEGEKVAEGLRKATKGTQAANKQLATMESSLPDLEKALLESRKSVGQTRASLGAALKQQAETEKLLQSVPTQTAALAEALPKIGRTMATMLKETKKLRELAKGLKAVQQSLDDSLKSWPEVAKGLKQSAAVLDKARAQLDETTSQRGEYEKAMQSTAQVARSLADLLPAFTDQLDSRLGQQEASLEQMETGLGEVNKSLPMMEEKTSDLIGMVKLLLYLVGTLLAFHALWVLAESLTNKQKLGRVEE